jgi:replicative superfamily II helicase
VFHSEQAVVYERLLSGENVVLSAPTSFGKSLVIDALLAARDFRNAAVVVPTIALMDECRRRLARLGDRYKIITHGTQRLTDRNLFVMTQERLLEIDRLPPLDFFAIDEFYKLDPDHSDERSNQLNILFHRL